MGYVSTYPPAHSDTYVKATTKYDTNYWPYFATDPAKSLIGNAPTNSWLSVNNTYTNQRFHIDLGSAKVVKRIYYENHHGNGFQTTSGIRAFTLWGSNDASAFADLTYGSDTNWTQLTTDVSEFDQHKAENNPDPKYVLVTNTTAYRYYAIKASTCWGATNFMGVRRIELQIDDFTETLAEGFTIHSEADAFNLTDTLAEGMSIHSEAQGGFEFDLTLSENLTVNSAAQASLEVEKQLDEGFTIDDAVNVETEVTLPEQFSMDAAAAAQLEYSGDPLLENIGLSSVAEAEFAKFARRVRFPYRAQGRHLTIRFRLAEPGQWLRLLDISMNIEKLVGITNSDKKQYFAKGLHLTIRFRHNVVDEALNLLYARMTVEKHP